VGKWKENAVIVEATGDGIERKRSRQTKKFSSFFIKGTSISAQLLQSLVRSLQGTQRPVLGING